MKDKHNITSSVKNADIYNNKIPNGLKALKKGTIVTTVILGTIEVGTGAYDDYNDYQTTVETKGKNTVVAAAKVGTGVAVGWAAGAATGAVIGTAIPIQLLVQLLALL